MLHEKSKVVLLHVEDYDTEKIYEAIKFGIDALGGISKFAMPGEKILLKPNLLKKSEVDKAVITNPALVEAVIRIFRESYTSIPRNTDPLKYSSSDSVEGSVNDAIRLELGDSVGFGGGTSNVIKGTGMDRACEKYNVDVIDFSEGVHVDFPEGKQAKSFIIPKEILEADGIISLCKMKTHALERLTGAVKNSYGYIYGNHKALGHTKYPSPDSFARMLVDLNKCIKTRLFIMDGIVAMEGNGPGSGDPVAMNTILISEDPVALDSVFARLVNLKTEMVPTCLHGSIMGLGKSNPDEIDIITPSGSLSFEEAFQKYGKADFNVPREKGKSMIDRLTAPFRAFQKKPYIIETNCIKCGICVESCPVEGKAIDFVNGKDSVPVYDYKKCIRCFCCQELCPHKAICIK